MSESRSTTKTSTTAKKRFHLGMIFNQVAKLFVPANNNQEEKPKPKKFFVLPSISITSPDGETTPVE
ncbi:unnamed protein product [Rotaria sordida]|uniref:Uncharacterized protein n=1 Tax=Rotaria sordida TaxID=392033 RepID=A0A815XS17_9BILA|nr:unnamed protein product [Rotaria sordida]CAF1560832.1 unnamed protein product [Rotaria sordida]CAF3618181.1 unnamed protein product [Rotaria sordida]